MDKEQIVSQAQAACGRMADACDIRALATVAEFADYGPHLLRSLLKHELVCDHAVKMRMAAKIDHYLGLVAADRSTEDQDRGCRQAAQLAGASARLSGHFRQGLAALERFDRQAETKTRRQRKAEDRELGLDDDLGDDDDPGPKGGSRMPPAKLMAQMQAMQKEAEAMLARHKTNAVKPNGNGNGTHLAAPGQRRGTLRHGNPSGDFLSAPRCGAKCRAGHACRQPAMPNGRCRLHGGKSTGARTADGLAKCRTATLVHGCRSAEIIDLKSAAARHTRNTRALVQAARTVGAHGARPSLPHHATQPTGAPQSDQPTPRPATQPRMMHAEARSRGEHHVVAATHLFSASSAPPRANPHSERPTPCPARNLAGRLPVDAAAPRPYIDAPFPRRRIAVG